MGSFIATDLLYLSTEVVAVGYLLLIGVNHFQESVMAVILPLCDVGCHCLIRHNQRAHGLQHLTHLTVVILDSTTTVLAKHQPSDTVVRRVDTTVMVLHVVLRMVGIVDGCQTTVVVLVIDGLALFFEVGCLLGEYIAEIVISKCGNTAGRMIDLRATVAHVIDGCRDVALGVGHLHEAVVVY